MSRYFTIRCYIDCDEAEQAGIKTMVQAFGTSNDADVDDERAELYRRGWCFREAEMNWVKHVFYGGSVRENGRDLVLSDISNIAKSFPEAEGMVVIDSDDGDVHEIWSIKDGGLIKAADDRKTN
ncbi:MAG: hypothetical protein EA381_20325 [Planctomycetaceae bacterium]|nr:MAG: hypothetical protein EA381_20325 [Planctomycetaceae bacterium]